MSIIHAVSTVGAKGGGGIGTWNPTIIGRISTNGVVVYSYGNDDSLEPNFAVGEADAGIWLIRTSDNCYIRCGGNAAGGLQNYTRWYNTSGANQGDPGTRSGTGTNIFTLGLAPDSVNIYNVSDSTVTGTPIYATQGSSYTSDNKSTFFEPTIDTKYGRYVDCLASRNTTGVTFEEGATTVQFTFRKSGETDYTVTFKARAESRAFVEF